MVRTVTKFAWLPTIVTVSFSDFGKKKIIWLREYREYQKFEGSVYRNHWGVPNFQPTGWKVIRKELV